MVAIAKSKIKKPLLFLIAGILLLMLAPTAFAIDLGGSMRISRAVKAGANECYYTVANVQSGDNVKMLGRNADGSWVFIWADAGDGWVPTSSVNVSGNVQALSVWTDHFNGASCAPAPQPVDVRICGREGNVTSGSTIRWTDIYSTADPDATTGDTFPPNTSFTFSGRDFWGCWVKVTGGGATGWMPIDAFTDRGIMSLPILIDNSQGCSIDDGKVDCPAG